MRSNWIFNNANSRKCRSSPALTTPPFAHRIVDPALHHSKLQRIKWKCFRFFRTILGIFFLAKFSIFGSFFFLLQLLLWKWDLYWIYRMIESATVFIWCVYVCVLYFISFARIKISTVIVFSNKHSFVFISSIELNVWIFSIFFFLVCVCVCVTT